MCCQGMMVRRDAVFVNKRLEEQRYWLREPRSDSPSNIMVGQTFSKIQRPIIDAIIDKRIVRFFQ